MAGAHRHYRSVCSTSPVHSSGGAGSAVRRKRQSLVASTGHRLSVAKIAAKVVVPKADMPADLDGA